MSANDNPLKPGGVHLPDEMARTTGMSSPDHSRNGEITSRNFSPSALANTTRPVYPAIGQPHATISGASVTVALSKPHRAWEEGYQSSFARASHQPLSSLHIDALRGLPAADTGPQFKTHWSSRNSPPSVKNLDPRVQRAPNPATNLPDFPHAINGRPTFSPNSEYAAPRRPSTYRPRVRKVVTKEITINDNDIAAMVALGLSPFMVDQDAIANQNRFVRNECLLARHFLRLQRAASEADIRHSQTERDLYRHLEQQQSALDTLEKVAGPTTSASSNIGIDAQIRLDSDFLELKREHQETSARLEALSLQVTQSSESTQRALTDLAKRLDQIIHTGTSDMTDPDDIASSPTATASLSPLSSTKSFDLKRKRGLSADSIIASPSTTPPSTPDFHNHVFD